MAKMTARAQFNQDMMILLMKCVMRVVYFVVLLKTSVL